MNEENTIKNPCTGDCKYDENKICVSCNRSMFEIVSWTDFTDEKKITVLKRIGIGERQKKKGNT